MTFKAQKVMSNQLLQYLYEDGSGNAGVLAQAESQTAVPNGYYPCLVLFCSLLVHPHSVGPQQLTQVGGGGASLGGESP